MSTTATDTREPLGYRELIRGNANFRFLWCGQIISLLGDWFNLIASASLIASLTQSGLAIGSLFIVRMLAPFLVSPIAGVVADRFNRKHILIAADLARAITVCGFLLVRDPGHVWLLYSLTAIQLGLSGFFYPARNAILPDIVPPRGIGAANALSSATWSVMLALGAALGGMVSGLWGLYPAFIIDSLTFLLSAAAIARVKLDARPGADSADKIIDTALQQYLNGLRYLRAHADILVTALNKAALALFFGSAFEVVQVAIAKDIFPLGVGGGFALGLMYGASGIGSGLGPIIARHFTGDRIRALRLTIVLGYLMASAGLLITSSLSSFTVILAGILLRGLGSGIVWVFSTQLLLQLVPGRIQGRIFSTEFAIFTLMGAVGAAMAGHTLDAAPAISDVVRRMAGLTLIPGFLWALWHLRGKFARPGREDPPA